MSRRRRYEHKVILPWERRIPVLSWLSLGRARAFVTAGVVLVCAWAFLASEDYRRRVHATRAAIRSVMVAADAFRADHGRCPTNIDELVNPPEVAGVTAHYLSSARLDGWDRPLRMTCPGGKHPGSVDVVSGGPTGTFLDLEQIE
jgi:hypothetical protein